MFNKGASPEKDNNAKTLTELLSIHMQRSVSQKFELIGEVYEKLEFE